MIVIPALFGWRDLAIAMIAHLARCDHRRQLQTMFHDECASTSQIGNTRRHRLRALVAAAFITKAKSRRAA